VFGPERPAAVCRELTKTYEEVRRDTVAELAMWAAEGVRGEVTVVVGGAPVRQPKHAAELVGEVQALVDTGSRLKDAAAKVAAEHQVGRRELYEAMLASRSAGFPSDGGT
jgi:16S rRNA (cytidine1402-2'-O)-methyltransferase